MPATVSRSSDDATVTAPDGIAIHTFDLPPGEHAGVAEGRIPPGAYGIHRHLSLEQFTFVIAGRVTAITGNEEHPDGQAVTLEPGDLLLTLPGESLQFVNEGSEPARVLFICAPPYPADDSDTRVLAAHGPHGTDSVAEAIGRLEAVRRRFNEVIDRRIAALKDGTSSR
jgi:mannose-6-phosphate isomerase-like protein (cupin superfamily)